MKTISFVHIPKTAGGTIIQTVSQQTSASNCLRLSPLFPRVSNWSNASARIIYLSKHYLKSAMQKAGCYRLFFEKQPVITYGRQQYSLYTNQPYKNIRFISGHIPAGLDQKIYNFNIRVSLIRNPVDRYYSWYYHQKRDRRSIYYNFCQKYAPAELLRKLKSDNHLEANNPQMHYLGIDNTEDLYVTASKKFQLLYAQDQINDFMEFLGQYMELDLSQIHSINKNQTNKSLDGYSNEDDYLEVVELASNFFNNDIKLYSQISENGINRIG